MPEMKNKKGLSTTASSPKTADKKVAAKNTPAKASATPAPTKKAETPARGSAIPSLEGLSYTAKFNFLPHFFGRMLGCPIKKGSLSFTKEEGKKWFCETHVPKLAGEKLTDFKAVAQGIFDDPKCVKAVPKDEYKVDIKQSADYEDCWHVTITMLKDAPTKKAKEPKAEKGTPATAPAKVAVKKDAPSKVARKKEDAPAPKAVPPASKKK